MKKIVLTTTTQSIDVEGIQRLLPHRYPMLMIDRVIDMESGLRATGIKNVTINEPFFQGHFPGHPVMPGVLIIEAMAQTAAVVVVTALERERDGSVVYFMSIDQARFRKPVLPGDTMYLHVEKQRSRGNVWKFTGLAKVNDVLVAEATYAAMIRDL
ncbi:MAG: 3-hydroxyacyl-ACP dehydratase FabZ [Rhodospirillales bacterium]|uniref:3-hydroxyacyl-[acyl-carrier-protein] dehydratase FabZ n=2 Tax=root TaxID=1 RepID=A0A564WA13_9PROT|nr:3-hydroxyacyl-ACP dehydratase FabZ [Rhodospirillales bacterium]MDG4575230.1 3-hydroxyacyl-ACP dehydratase FabZ [Defluviicoccus sp.]SUS07368.1 (3R)-hydroxymyristol acyl carrier protein dehydratase [uncultured Defluviicoccus sp.]VUX44953.1 (3R)-hydroxymyristol acyl carrier protein dehydratase [Candidatus Defluviicoccus seviourii]MDG4591416.1 3-hydroxyacyl-ACP dehydratase FabZ [Defluviicoccus sp.]